MSFAPSNNAMHLCSIIPRDVDGIFGGSAKTYVRDLQFKALMTTTMVMSGYDALFTVTF